MLLDRIASSFWSVSGAQVVRIMKVADTTDIRRRFLLGRYKNYVRGTLRFGAIKERIRVNTRNFACERACRQIAVKQTG